MILVDTSVWIDFLNGRSTDATNSLNSIMERDIPFAITGVIYQEILQGADSDENYQNLAEYFSTQRFLHPTDNIEVHARAAELYRLCRSQGVTIRSTIDCLIAQIAIDSDSTLLHSDKDFTHMSRVIADLKIYEF